MAMRDKRPPISDSSAATLEAFYARVIDRVCTSYRSDGDVATVDAVARLQQKWQEKLVLYTGKSHAARAIEAADEDEDDDRIVVVDSAEASSDSELSEGSSSATLSSLSLSSSTGLEGATESKAVGRPRAALPSGATSTTTSVFAKMLGSKRKLHQLDGSISDAEVDVDCRDVVAAVEEDEDEEKEEEELSYQNQGDRRERKASCSSLSTAVQNAYDDAKNGRRDEAVEEKDGTEYDNAREKTHEEGERSAVCERVLDEEPPARPPISSSLLVSADDLAPVSGLSGISLPLQIAAQYSRFRNYGNRKGYRGQLHAIVLTWPRRLRAGETIHPGELVWCYPESVQGLISEGKMGKMISRGDSRHEMNIEFDDGTKAVVSMDRVRRLSEYLIRKGRVCFTEQ